MDDIMDITFKYDIDFIKQHLNSRVVSLINNIFELCIFSFRKQELQNLR